MNILDNFSKNNTIDNFNITDIYFSEEKENKQTIYKITIKNSYFTKIVNNKDNFVITLSEPINKEVFLSKIDNDNIILSEDNKVITFKKHTKNGNFTIYLIKDIEDSLEIEDKFQKLKIIYIPYQDDLTNCYKEKIYIFKIPEDLVNTSDLNVKNIEILKIENKKFKVQIYFKESINGQKFLIRKSINKFFIQSENCNMTFDQSITPFAKIENDIYLKNVLGFGINAFNFYHLNSKKYIDNRGFVIYTANKVDVKKCSFDKKSNSICIEFCEK